MKKNLLVFAHKGEAAHFLKKISFTPVDFFFKGLFQSEIFLLLITGEGLHNASEKTVSVLTQFHNDIDTIFNIGTAGSLVETISSEELHWIKSVCAGSVEYKEYKSFNAQASDTSTTCLSAYARIKDTEARIKLSPMANIVDRELWAVASAATLFKKPFQSLKYISDDLKSENFCQDVINQAPLISEQLYLEFMKSTSAVR